MSLVLRCTRLNQFSSRCKTIKISLAKISWRDKKFSSDNLRKFFALIYFPNFVFFIPKKVVRIPVRNEAVISPKKKRAVWRFSLSICGFIS